MSAQCTLVAFIGCRLERARMMNAAKGEQCIHHHAPSLRVRKAGAGGGVLRVAYCVAMCNVQCGVLRATNSFFTIQDPPTAGTLGSAR